MRTFLFFLSPAPLLFALAFLFASPVRSLVMDGDPAAVGDVGGVGIDTVVLLFDEFPVAALLDGEGELDATRFPGFGRLAATTTWYPQAATVAPYTNVAVPALLTGRLPDATAPPVAAQHPRSLFTALGGSHELHVWEQITSLCPAHLCPPESPGAGASPSLSRDTGTIMLHQLLPQSLAERWLPSISGRWTGFGLDGAGGTAPEEAAAAQDGADLTFEEWREQQAEQAEAGGPPELGGYPSFVASIEPGAQPGLWYRHEMLPHLPFRYLPDGRTYPGGGPLSLGADVHTWSSEHLATVGARQRLLLQVGYADHTGWCSGSPATGGGGGAARAGTSATSSWTSMPPLVVRSRSCAPRWAWPASRASATTRATRQPPSRARATSPRRA